MPAYPEARQRAESLGLGAAQIRWLGPVDGRDLPALYAAATLFVFPSLYEGFGLPPLEAMACGTAVACSRIPALQEITTDGAYGFDPLSVTSIADAISEVLDREVLRQDLRRRGLACAAEYSWDQTASYTMKLYRDVLAREGGPEHAE